MGSQPNPTSNLVFGAFRYDEHSGVLTKFGTRLRLHGKPLQILTILIDKPGQIISREELQHHLWQGTTFVDFDQGLNSAVNKLRQALGDSADQPRYVETVAGRGYRFIAPVQKASSSVVLEMVQQPSPLPLRLEPEPEPRGQPPPAARLMGRVALAVVALTIVAGAAGYWFGNHSKQPLPPPGALKLSIAPPPGFALEGAASRQAFALSPDGTRLAFTAMDASGEFSVFLRDFNSLESRLVPDSQDAHTLFWPPDSRSLYYTAKGRLWRTPLEGNQRVLVSDAPSFMFSGAWLNPGRLLLDSFRASNLVSPSGGPFERLKEIYLWPQLLPDGEHLLYVRWDARAGRHRSHVLRLSDLSDVKDLLETDSRVQYAPSSVTPGTGHLLYVRGGDLLANPFDARSLQITGETMPVVRGIYSFSKTGAADFSVSQTGVLAYQSYISRSQLVWVDRTGSQLGTIGPAGVNLKSARLSPNGQLLATAIYDPERGQQDLWIFDVKTNLGRRLASDPNLRDAPVWSPDSRSLAFLFDNVGQPPKVHIRAVDGNETEEVMPAADFQLPTDWSPDGRFVAFTNTGFPRSASETQSDIWLFDLIRNRKRIPLLTTKFHEANPVFSPDGKWLAFTSNESDRPELYVQAFQSGDDPALVGARHLVSSSGALAVRWRRDGKELFYLDLNGRVQTVSVRLSAKPEFGKAAALFSISTEARAAIHSVLGFDVSGDGSRFAIVKAPASPSIVVIQNWESLLPAKH
ncbi:MAG: winged helix-turn-helix domain-containing protein [Bryobacteraceae bacterium]